MSITSRGVTIQKRGRNYWLLSILTAVELVFSFLLIVSLASNLLFPQRASAVAGVSAKLSYQGRLTDLSGSPLGGSGTNYCFRFSIYDAATAGTKVWPAGAPSSTTVKVEDGVFNTDLGTADSLATFDFASNDSLYLNVEVNATPTTCGGSWEQLDLRQRIDSVGYARAAEGVYSSLLRAPTGGTAVQIGTGAGAATPIFLNLDVKNTQEAVDDSCSTNGQLWYNSADSRARVCQGSVIQDIVDNILVKDEGTNQGRASTALDFTGGGVSASKGTGGVININIPFQGVAVNAAGTVSSGFVVFSNSNNVTFGINGSTITASITAAGGGAANLSIWRHPKGNANLTSLTNLTGLSMRPFFVPIVMDGNITVRSLGLNVSRSATGSNLFTVQYGIYTYVNSTQISAIATAQDVFSGTATVSQSGARMLWLTNIGTHANASTMTPGNYVLGFFFSTSGGTASMNYFIRGAYMSSASNFLMGQIFPGTNQYSTNTSQGAIPMFGRYSTTHAAPIRNTYAQSNIYGLGSAASQGIDPAIYIRNFT